MLSSHCSLGYGLTAGFSNVVTVNFAPSESTSARTVS